MKNYVPTPWKNRGVGQSDKSRWWKATALLYPLILGAILSLGPGCWGNSECRSDEDCGEGHFCAPTGGVMVSPGVCIAEENAWDFDEDAGDDDAKGGDGDTDDGDVDTSAPECDDGQVSGDQTDVDCGGSVCPPCENGKNCNVDGDCISDFCDDGICANPCGGGETSCGGDCVDLQSNENHCGSCDNDCSEDEECNGGTCECIAECCGDADCDGLLSCVEGVCECTTECCADSDCFAHLECSAGGSCECNYSCCTPDDCAGGAYDECSNRWECIDSSEPCEDSCDCPAGWHCSSNSCMQVAPGPLPPQCCTDPYCDAGDGCVELDGSSGTC